LGAYSSYSTQELLEKSPLNAYQTLTPDQKTFNLCSSNNQLLHVDIQAVKQAQSRIVIQKKCEKGDEEEAMRRTVALDEHEASRFGVE